MKKSLSIIALLLAMIFVFTACSNPPTPELVDRWESETVTFVISKATEDNVKDFEEEIPVYSKVPGAQIEPEDVEGILTYSIAKSQNNWVLEVEMFIRQTYSKDVLPSNWKDIFSDHNFNAYTEGSDGVIITSVMTSVCEFETVYDNGAPIRSEKRVSSVVVYYDEETKPSLAVNNFIAQTTYDDDEATTVFEDIAGTADKDDEYSVSLGDGQVFDNETMLMIVRSIDMEMLAEAKSMDINFYNQTEGAVQTATIVIADTGYKLDESEDTYYRVGVNLKDVSGCAYFMYFEQKEKIAPPEAIGKLIPQQQLVEMNSGYMHFERI